MTMVRVSNSKVKNACSIIYQDAESGPETKIRAETLYKKAHNNDEHSINLTDSDFCFIEPHLE